MQPMKQQRAAVTRKAKSQQNVKDKKAATMCCGKMLSTSISCNTSKCMPTHSSATAIYDSKLWAVYSSTALKILLLLFVLQLLLPLKYVVAADGKRAVQNIRLHSMPHFKPNRSTIVQLFEWKFADVAEECKSFLGPKGYGGVQLSPVTEHLMYESELLQHPWWERYYPVSYAIASRSGNEEDFLAMSRTCNEAGVRIYVDVVLNHMAGGKMLGEEEEAIQGFAESKANASALEYPAVPYGSEDFHKPCDVIDYTDAHEVRNCQLDGRPDLDHSRASVRQLVVELLDKLVDLGVAGFYVDAAKYMWPADLKKIFNAVKNLSSEEFDFPEQARPFFYQDVLDLGTEAISKTEYSGNGVVTEYLYAAELAIIFSGKAPLSSLINWGPVMGFLPHYEAVVFVDSHDSQRGGLKQLGSIQMLTHRWPSRYIMANVFMLAHPFGVTKRIMSSYRFAADAVDQGPPTSGDDDDAIIAAPQFDDAGQCTLASGWVCEHRWPAIANMIELVNNLNELQDTVINFQTDGPQHISFCRGNKAFIALNNDATLDYETEVFTCLKAGTYCDIISGGRTADGSNCHGRRIVVDAEGKANLSLPALASTQSAEETENTEVVADFGVIAIYLGSKLSDEAAAALPVTNAKSIKEAGNEGKPTVTDVKSEFEFVAVPDTAKTVPDSDGEANEADNADEATKELATLNEKQVAATAGTVSKTSKDDNTESMKFSALN